MKKLFYFTALLPIMFLQCTKEENLVEDRPFSGEYTLVPVCFDASFAEETKTTLEGTDVHWVSGDKIAVYDNVDPSVKHEFTASVTGDKTSFTGEVAAGATKYFAVYPYSAAVSCDAADWVNGSTPCAGKLQVEVLEVQEATEGSFDPYANICMGYTNSTDNHLRFRIACSMLKFQVSRDDILAVTFSGSKNMSGSLQLNVTETGGIGTGDGTGTKLKTVTVKKSDGTPFTKGATYYAVVRYRTGDNAYGDFTAKLIAEGGEVGTKVAESTLGIERAHIKNIGNFSGLTYNKDLYAYYQLGYPVTIAGESYNKADDGDATLLNDSGVFKTTIEGVVFVAADASITNTSEATITGNVIMASSDPSHPATYTATSGKSILLKSGSLIMDNMKINMAAMESGQFFTKKDNDGNFSSLTLWQCDFFNIARPVYTPNSSYLNNGIEDVLINGCRFATTANVQLFFINSSVKTLAGYKSFTFKNNVLYSTGDAQTSTYVFRTDATGVTESTCNQELVMDNNLFYNVPNGNGLFRTYYLKSAYIRNNILWATDGTYSSNSKMFKTNLAVENATSPFTGGSSDNYCYGNLGDKEWTISDTDCRGPLTNVTTLDTNPIESFNVGTGEFEIVSTYRAYGPQLQPGF